ncbi:serpin family protein [Thermodesulfobacteriota bacterium]
MDTISKKSVPSTAGVKDTSDNSPIQMAADVNNAFAVDLYQYLRDQEGNLFFSPYSMICALAMAAEGARGETAEEMGKVLNFPETTRQTSSDAQNTHWKTTLIHTSIASLNEHLGVGKYQAAQKRSLDSYELSIANALWGEKTYPFRDDYVIVVSKYYKSGGLLLFAWWFE